MNDPISWDPSLVKKYSSSNHYKLLNQLRNEVKKYPLNNKKITSSLPSKDNYLENNKKSNTTHTQNSSFSINSNESNEVNIEKSTVSFSNSKNFSIYSQTNSNIRDNHFQIRNPSKSNIDYSSPTFKERLNQIDMK